MNVCVTLHRYFTYAEKSIEKEHVLFADENDITMVYDIIPSTNNTP